MMVILRRRQLCKLPADLLDHPFFAGRSLVFEGAEDIIGR